MKLPQFDIKNPNSVYSLVGGFTSSVINYHNVDGSGYNYFYYFYFFIITILLFSHFFLLFFLFLKLIFFLAMNFWRDSVIELNKLNPQVVA